MPSSSSTGPFVEDEMNLRDYWRVLVRRRALILSIVTIAVVTAAAWSLWQPNIYQSKATLMPLGQAGGGLQAAIGELQGLLSLGSPGKESPSERILAILQSRTLAEDLIQRLDLLAILFAKEWNTERQQWKRGDPPTLQAAVRALHGLVSVTSGKQKVIGITVEYTDPELAAAIANQYVDSLQRILNENAFSLAKKNRLFIEAQLQKTQQNLMAAEEALRAFEQEHGIISLEAQAAAAVSIIALLKGQIMAGEIQLGVLQRSRTGASQEVSLLQEELRGLRAQLARLQYGTPALYPPSGDMMQDDQVLPSLDKAPEIKLQYMRLQRDALIQNKLFTLLTQQLEQAKIEEARDETAFQVLDRAIPSKERIKPKRRQSVLLAAVVGAFLGVFLAFCFEYLDPTIRTREQVEHRIGMALLASIPPPPRRQQRSAPPSEADLVLHQPSGAPLLEAYRYLYTRLKHRNGGPGVHTVMFTSVGPDDATPTTLINLATVAANAGEKTLLVDGNIRQPVLHRLLQGPLAPGLSGVLTAPEEWQKGIQATAVDNLHLLPAGTASTATFFSLHSPAFDALLVHCKATYDLIFFAAPPVLGLSDAAMLSSKIDATCLVLACGVARLDAAEEAKAVLEAVQNNVVGAILVGFKA